MPVVEKRCIWQTSVDAVALKPVDTVSFNGNYFSESQSHWAEQLLRENQDFVHVVSIWCCGSLVQYLWLVVVKRAWDLTIDSHGSSGALLRRVTLGAIFSFFWWMWMSGLILNVVSACPVAWTFVTGLLVHIHQKEKWNRNELNPE
jgi:hypothetical protein